jgi:hypothetical protein
LGKLITAATPTAGFVDKLLADRRILVILDGLSEMPASPAEPDVVTLENPEFPANALLITSRDEEPDFWPSTIIEPLRIDTNHLLPFINAYLTGSGRDALTDSELFDASRHLAELVTMETGITPLLAWLFADQLATLQREETGIQSLPRTIPALMLSYLNSLNRDRSAGDPDDPTLHKAAKIAAWECIRETFRPGQPASKERIRTALAEAHIEKAHLERLETLRVLKTDEPAQSHVRFELDPLSEYLAALKLVEDYGEREDSWRAFLTDSDSKEGAPKAIRGFLLAVRDCCQLRTPVASTLEGVIKQLAAMYERSRESLHPVSSGQQPKRVLVELILERPSEALNPEELAEQIKNLVEERKYVLVNESEGCTRIVIEVTAEQASRIQAAFASGDVQFTGLIGVREVSATSRSTMMRAFAPKRELIDPTAPGATEHFKKSWRRIMAREELVRPWRRLRFLLSTDVRSCPLAHVISESNDRAYAAPGVLARLRSLAIDLRMTILLWPLMISAMLGVLFLCQPNPYPLTAISLGILSGVTLAVFGSQPCSVLVSPLACGGGTVVMGIAFGLAQTVIMARLEIGTLFSQAGIRGDFFLSVTGGLVGLSAPAWRTNIPMPLIVLLVVAIALSIATAGWLMGQPQRAKGLGERQGRWKNISGALLGAAAGSGIGFVYLFNRIIGSTTDQPTAFVLAFALIGGLWLGISTFLRMGGMPRSIVTAVSHVLVASALFEIAFWTAGSSAGLFALAAASGYFHSTGSRQHLFLVNGGAVHGLPLPQQRWRAQWDSQRF